MASFPLQEYELVHASDPDVVRDMVERVFSPYELVLVGSGGRFDGRLNCYRLVDTAVTFGAYGAEVLVQAGPVGTYFAVLIPLSGRVDFRCGGARFRLTQSVASVISPSVEDLALRLYEGTALLTCRVEQPALEAHLAGLLGQCLRRPLRFEPAMRIARGDGLIVSSRLQALVRDIDRGGRVVGSRLSAEAFESSLMTDLLVAQPHNYSAALDADVRTVGTREVRNAVALMESHPERQLTVASVATALSTSGRSLQRGFRRELGTTFRGELHQIRLRRAHDDLVRSDPLVVVANDVLARWGLPLEGYTYVAYRQSYGESPSETLHRLR